MQYAGGGGPENVDFNSLRNGQGILKSIRDQTVMLILICPYSCRQPTRHARCLTGPEVRVQSSKAFHLILS